MAAVQSRTVGTADAGAPGMAFMATDPFVAADLFRAWFESEQTLRVAFARAVDPATATAADGWALVRVDGAPLPEVLFLAAASPTSVRFRFASAPVRRGEFLTVSALGTILAASGEPVAPGTLVLEGIAPRPVRATVAPVYEPLVDLRSLNATGGIVTDGTGDYAASMSAETYRKVVIRAITTASEEWAHAPGFGVLPEMKRLATPWALRQIAEDGQRMIRAIPGTVSATVGASAAASGLVTITIRAVHQRFGVLALTAIPGAAGWEVSGG